MSKKAYLIIGNTGAGKSTYAKKLAVEKKAHIFNVDQWMKTLFLMDMPDPPQYQWALERTQRIERQMLLDGVQLLSNQINIILDIGFFAREQRDRVKSVLTKAGFTYECHYLDISKETRWQRVQQRNTEKTDTFQFEVSQEIFEFCETIFEVMDEDELADHTIHITEN
ncbi:ATP-binding protein [Terasakiella sp. A23]|uniref:AAA family ATPase n=1 Tax=Terasakiella sp. FCG-A23 TaxID=3080561 RepID=UPI002953F741|nr:ATP-binding protein [Terasakiella sp. A23]MDV7339447.1 ATP-binding protein [Terasakiella sp. A23]